MKNLFPALFLIAIISSCSVRNYPLGTPETEFTKHAKWVTQIAEKTQERTVYKRTDAMGRDLYYYFIDGKLTRIDENGPAKPVVIEHIQPSQ
jgi:hypothetical protein